MHYWVSEQHVNTLECVLSLINPSSKNTIMKCLLLLDVSAAMEMVVTETGACLWEQSYASSPFINRVMGFLRVLYLGHSVPL